MREIQWREWMVIQMNTGIDCLDPFHISDQRWLGSPLQPGLNSFERLACAFYIQQSCLPLESSIAKGYHQNVGHLGSGLGLNRRDITITITVWATCPTYSLFFTLSYDHSRFPVSSQPCSTSTHSRKWTRHAPSFASRLSWWGR
jgi:hypothetical protein